MAVCCLVTTGKPKAEVIELVHERARQVAAQLAAGQLPLGSFIITKQLTKRPEDYPDARVQPHVQVSVVHRPMLYWQLVMVYMCVLRPLQANQGCLQAQHDMPDCAQASSCNTYSESHMHVFVCCCR